MNTVGSVNLTLGSSQKVTVTVNENLVQYIRTTVQGSALMIETEPNHRYSNLQLTVDVTMTSLDKINCNGVGVIKSFGKLTVEFIDLVLTGAGEIDLNLESQLIKTGHTGAGTIILEGKSDRHEIAHSGAGSLRCFKLFTEETKVTHAGAGRIEVRADSLLDVSITGAGSVYYKGHPTIIQSITGTGGLIDAN
jgi:hypothetical protein